MNYQPEMKGNYRKDSPYSKYSLSDRSKIVRDADISPMRFQPDFTSEHLNRIHSQLDSHEEKLDNRSKIAEEEQNFTIHKVDENQNKAFRDQEPMRRGSAAVRNLSQSRGN